MIDEPEIQITQRFRKYPNYIPVIYGDGEKDDTMGLIAAYRNKPVLFDGRVYERGDPLSIVDRKIFISIPLWIARIGEELSEYVYHSNLMVFLPKEIRYVVFENTEFVQEYVTTTVTTAFLYTNNPYTDISMEGTRHDYDKEQ